jgi:hypothetical protein
MIEALTDMPAGTLGFEAVGEVHSDDYDSVLLPAIEAAIAEHGKVRMLYLLGDRFEGYSAGAAWEDTKLGATHPTKFERCAVVSDHDWVRHLVGGFGWMIPGEFKTFPTAELADAKAWLAEDA